MKNSTKYTLLATAALGLAAAGTQAKADDVQYIAHGTTINGSKVIDQNLERLVTESGGDYVRDGNKVYDRVTGQVIVAPPVAPPAQPTQQTPTPTTATPAAPVEAPAAPVQQTPQAPTQTVTPVAPVQAPAAPVQQTPTKKAVSTATPTATPAATPQAVPTKKVTAQTATPTATPVATPQAVPTPKAPTKTPAAVPTPVAQSVPKKRIPTPAATPKTPTPIATPTATPQAVPTAHAVPTPQPQTPKTPATPTAVYNVPIKQFAPQAAAQDGILTQVVTKPTVLSVTSGKLDDDKFPQRKLGTILTDREEVIKPGNVLPTNAPTKTAAKTPEVKPAIITTKTPQAVKVTAAPNAAKKSAATATLNTTAANSAGNVQTLTAAQKTAPKATAKNTVSVIDTPVVKGSALATLPVTGSEDGLEFSIFGALTFGLAAAFVGRKKYISKHERK